jgi:hypothetical protein
MKNLLGIALLGIFLFAAVAMAQPWYFWEIPKLTEPPEVDAVRGADEWANAFAESCSPSRMLEVGAEVGWTNEDIQESPVGFNQLLGLVGPDEDEAESGSDADLSDDFWMAWDEDGLYYIHQVRDNFRDIEDGGNVLAWWERDGVEMAWDLLNTREPGAASSNVLITLAVDPSADARAYQYLYHDGGTHVYAQEGEAIEGFEYAFREASGEFGSDADYVIEASLPWETFMRWNLPSAPEAGSVMSQSMIVADPDGEEGWGGQIQCWGVGDPINQTELIYTDTPAGVGTATAAEEDTWGHIKATFDN